MTTAPNPDQPLPNSFTFGNKKAADAHNTVTEDEMDRGEVPESSEIPEVESEEVMPQPKQATEPSSRNKQRTIAPAAAEADPQQ